jgi:methylase of polypeptide subunit release factors
VVALDINPAAVAAADGNAASNGLGDRIVAMQSGPLAALPPQPAFVVIIASTPHFPGEPRDVADRGWHAGPDYRDVADPFTQAMARLAPGGPVGHLGDQFLG